MIGAPTIAWIQNDPHQHQVFHDGSKFLVCLRVHNIQTDKTGWEYAVVVTSCDEDGMTLRDQSGEHYGEWEWSDFEYFALIEGEMPYPFIEQKQGGSNAS